MSRPWQRWSAVRKRDVVLRVLRGEPVEGVAREVKVPVLQLERWRRQFLDAGRAGLRVRPDSSDARESREAQAKILELTNKIELLERALEEALVRGGSDPSSSGVRGEPSRESSERAATVQAARERHAAGVAEWSVPEESLHQEGGPNPRWAR